MRKCPHNGRYGLLGLPPEADGCLACAYEQSITELRALVAERDWALSKAGITHGVYDELYALRAKCDALQEENERLRNNGKIVIESLCDACLVKLSGV